MKGLAINTGESNHFLDHMAPFCYLMQIPLLVTEEQCYESAKEYYPQITSLYIPYDEVDCHYLAQTYDTFFQTVLWRENLIRYFGVLQQKPLVFVRLIHGDSDKGYISESSKGFQFQEINLLYGPHSYDRFQKQEVLQHSLYYDFLGNFRLQYYQTFQPFLDEIIEEKVFSRLPKNQPTLFYAPTWNDEEKSTSFYDLAPRLVKQLPPHWNLIIKPHPFLEERDPAFYYQTISEEKKENILILENFPLIYPLLARCSAYLGDFSSIGYDALSFQKPLFFYDPYQRPLDHPSRCLHSCGVCLEASHLENLFPYLEDSYHFYPEALWEKQKKMYQYTFGEEQKFSVLRPRIEEVCHEAAKNCLHLKEA